MREKLLTESYLAGFLAQTSVTPARSCWRCRT
jgi:hypothetical protein